MTERPFMVWVDGHTHIALSAEIHSRLDMGATAGDDGIPGFCQQYVTDGPPQYGKRYVVRPDGTATVPIASDPGIVQTATVDPERIKEIINRAMGDAEIRNRYASAIIMGPLACEAFVRWLAVSPEFRVGDGYRDLPIITSFIIGDSTVQVV